MYSYTMWIVVYALKGRFGCPDGPDRIFMYSTSAQFVTIPSLLYCILMSAKLVLVKGFQLLVTTS